MRAFDFERRPSRLLSQVWQSHVGVQKSASYVLEDIRFIFCSLAAIASDFLAFLGELGAEACEGLSIRRVGPNERKEAFTAWNYN